MAINFARYESLKYVDLPNGLAGAELEVIGSGDDDEESSVLALHAEELESEGGIALNAQAFDDLTEYLGVPGSFAKKLRKSKKSHVMAYLQKQLASSWGGGIPLIAVVDPDANQIVSITEKSYLFFRGGYEALTLDLRLRELCAREDANVSLMDCVDGKSGIIHYRFFQGESRNIDLSVDKSKWRWGVAFSHSPYGVEMPKAVTFWEREENGSITYRPEKAYNWSPEFDGDFEARWSTLDKFLSDPPEAQFGMLEGFLKRAQTNFASLKEVKKVKGKLSKFHKGTDDEAPERIDLALKWKEIEEGYPQIYGPEADFKPSAKWAATASTPVTYFSLYNFLAQEATHAPSDMDENDTRLPLLIAAGELLTKVPDLQDTPPPVEWE